LAPPSGSTASLEPSAALQAMSELDAIDAGWD
jgi:hypothetical protein